MDVITFPENLKTTCGLPILLHCVISLTDATSYDNCYLFHSFITSCYGGEEQGTIGSGGKCKSVRSSSDKAYIFPS